MFDILFHPNDCELFTYSCIMLYAFGTTEQVSVFQRQGLKHRCYYCCFVPLWKILEGKKPDFFLLSFTIAK